MIQITNLSKSFGSQELFSDVTFNINQGERVGLVGRNGSGKSTLLKILMKEESADSGEVIFPKNYKIGMLSQHLHFTSPSILEEAVSSLPSDQQHDVYLAEKMLMGLGFSKQDFDRAPSDFSGGYQIRLNLVKVLLSNPNALLLDEPTNYLDILSLRWLQNFLRNFRGEVVMITHDRNFMDEVVTHTMGIWRQKLVKVAGTTHDYYNQILEAEDIYEKTRVNQERKRKDLESFVNKFRAKARQASLAQSRLKMLEKMPEMQALEEIENLDFHFNYADCPAKTLMEVKDLSFGYQKEKPLFKNLSFSIMKGDRIAIIGKNGKGKSTLLNNLSGDLTSDSGSLQKHPLLSIGHFGQTNINRLYSGHTVEEEIASAHPQITYQKVRNVCGTMMFTGDLAKKSVKVLSGGERARVLLGKILVTPCNLLLLDEPTNHLDQESVETLTMELTDFPGALVVVTHSEGMLRALANKLIIFHHDRAEFFSGSYDDFLEKIGWEDEEGEVPKGKINKLSRQEQKLLRQEIILERSKKLKPLKQEIEKLESLIFHDEKEIPKLEDQLVQFSQQSQSAELQKASQQLAGLKKRVDENFERLTELTLEHDHLFQDFEKRLNETLS